MGSEAPTRGIGGLTRGAEARPGWDRASGDQDAELAAAVLPPPDPPEDDPEEDDEPEDDPDVDGEPEDDEDDPDEDEEDELSPEDDSDLAGLLAVPPAVVSEPDARESVR